MKPNQTQFSVLSLNVQGICNTKKRKTIFTWLKDHNVHNSITFLQECHSDVQTQAKWSQDWPGTTYFSHGTTHSCGVITHVGKNLEFSFKDKIVDDNGRYIILMCEIQGSEYLLVNVYAPNNENQQLVFYSELEECISSLKLPDNTLIIWGGDFNCHLTNLDAYGGRGTFKRKSVNKIESIIYENDLCDIWRLKNENLCQFTWRFLNPLIQRQLDYFLVSNCLQPFVNSCKICNAVSTDHSAVILSISELSKSEKGPSHWRLNTSLLKDKQYVATVMSNLPLWSSEYTGENAKLKWEWLKFRIREFSIKYSKQKAKLFKCELKQLEQDVSKYEQYLTWNQNNEQILQKYKETKMQLQDHYDYVTQGIIIRSRIFYIFYTTF